MLFSLESYRRRISDTVITIMSLSVFIISQTVIIIMTRKLGYDFLGIQVTFSSERFTDIALSWRTSGLLDAYYRHFYLDYLHPFIYSIFLSSFMAKAFNRRRIAGRFDHLLLLPFAAAILDLMENSIHIYLLADFNRITAGMVLLSGIFTNLKWAVSLLCFLVSSVMFFFCGEQRYIMDKIQDQII